ncbi:MAG: hypothetical protein AAF050_24095, partial [Cyanobacteria bacterium J06649_5]
MQHYSRPIFAVSAILMGLAVSDTVSDSLTQLEESLVPVVLASHDSRVDDMEARAQRPVPTVPLSEAVNTYFGTVAGDGAPSYNELALEKNVRYCQRSLIDLGLSPVLANLFFANGNDGQATVRFLDDNDAQQFKAPEIEELDGA